MCFKEYVGPSRVLYDEELDCIIPAKNSNIDYAFELIMKPDETYCNRKQLTPDDKYWETKRCDPQGKALEDDIVNVKHSRNENYIYCNSLKIKIYEKLDEVECPDFVFPLPSNMSFQIGRLKYNSQQIRIQNQMHFEPELSHRINFQLAPKSQHKLDLSEDMKALDQLTESINTESPKYVFGNYVVSTSMTIIVISLVGILFGCLWFFFRKRNRDRNMRQATYSPGEQIGLPTILEEEEPEAITEPEVKPIRKKCVHR